MFDYYQFTSIFFPAAVLILWVFTFFTAPMFRCSAFGGACFVAALPFCIPLFERTQHGHPDLRGVIFIFLAAPLFASGIIGSIVGLQRATQRRLPCIATLLLNVLSLLAALPFL